LETELFGHERGAFTGAVSRQVERSNMPKAERCFWTRSAICHWLCKPNFYAFLQNRIFQRVGSAEDVKADVRIVSASNRNLEEMVAQGKFREDLYFRLNEMPIIFRPCVIARVMRS